VYKSQVRRQDKQTVHQSILYFFIEY